MKKWQCPDESLSGTKSQHGRSGAPKNKGKKIKGGRACHQMEEDPITLSSNSSKKEEGTEIPSKPELDDNLESSPPARVQ